jgi:aconitate hydratase
MEPRFMGCRVVLARSFARIAEANLKKQGVLTLTFADAGSYDKVRVDDVVDLDGLTALASGSSVQVVLRHGDGTTDTFVANHTLSEEHIEWFRAGSALNLLASRR